MTDLPPLQILVIEDDPDTRANLVDILELDDYRVATAGTVAEALRRDNWANIAVIVLDRRLPDGTAEQVLPRLRELAPQAGIIIVTGYADLEGAIAAVRQGAADYLLKPVNIDMLRSRIDRVVTSWRHQETINRLNKDLQHRVDELQTLLDVIPSAIAIAHDPECRVIRVNPAFGKLLGLPPDHNASLSAPPEELPPYKVFRRGRELKPEEMPIQQAAARGEEITDVELDIVHPDGRTINLFGSAAPLFDERGQPRGAIGAFVDITDRKREQEHRLQTERLAAIGQMMTGLAHESGNALARSRACLEMLAWEVQDRPEALSLIERTQKAQDHLQQLYEEVRGYAAPMKLDRELFSIAGVWRQAWDNLALARQEKDASLHEQTAGVDLRCPVDPFRLGQVFRNLFENSLAACTPPVEVVITCADTQLAGRPALRVAVRDNGPGLSAEQKQRIFEPFYTTKTKGTGLGMAIAKRIVEAHGAQIAVGSSAGPGAEIVLTLPREVP